MFGVRRSIMYEHLLHPGCSVSSMREYCRIPQKNFSGRFKRCTGFVPANWLSYHRIEAAKFLLADERLKDVEVCEIGFAVGYKRASTFTTMFRNKAGKPPGEWRTQRLKKPKRKLKTL